MTTIKAIFYIHYCIILSILSLYINGEFFNIMKPSDGLKKIWKRECQAHCEKYWWLTKALPISRYKRCVQTCIVNKKEKERPDKNKK